MSPRLPSVLFHRNIHGISLASWMRNVCGSVSLYFQLLHMCNIEPSV